MDKLHSRLADSILCTTGWRHVVLQVRGGHNFWLPWGHQHQQSLSAGLNCYVNNLASILTAHGNWHFAVLIGQIIL